MSRCRLALLAVVLTAAVAPAQSTYTWTGAGGNFWGTPTSWTPTATAGVSPGLPDTAAIPTTAASRTIEINANAASGHRNSSSEAGY